MSTTIPPETRDRRYPIGRFNWDQSLDDTQRRATIAAIAEMPRLFRAAVIDLDEQQLDTPYRPDGWTVRQVVHHVADSHMNGYIRFKLALTEDTPTIKPYAQAAWARLADVQTPIETSLAIVAAVSERWVRILHAMQPSDFARLLIHPEHERPLSLDQLLAFSEWHGRHHTAHVNIVRHT